MYATVIFNIFQWMILLCREQKKRRDVQFELNETKKELSQLVWTVCTIFISDESKSENQKGSVFGVYLCVYRVRVFIRFAIVCSLSVLIGSCSDMSSWNKIDCHHHKNKTDFPIKNLNRDQVEAWAHANSRRPRDLLEISSRACRHTDVDADECYTDT